MVGLVERQERGRDQRPAGRIQQRYQRAHPCGPRDASERLAPPQVHRSSLTTSHDPAAIAVPISASASSAIPLPLRARPRPMCLATVSASDHHELLPRRMYSTVNLPSRTAPVRLRAATAALAIDPSSRTLSEVGPRPKQIPT